MKRRSFISSLIIGIASLALSQRIAVASIFPKAVGPMVWVIETITRSKDGWSTNIGTRCIQRSERFHELAISEDEAWVLAIDCNGVYRHFIKVPEFDGTTAMSIQAFS